jgi:hypothetical protein
MKNSFFQGINLLLKIFKSLIFLPSLVSCQLQAKSLQNNLVCNKLNSDLFENCIHEKFPIGSTYTDLKKFLKNQGFNEAKDPEHIKRNKFYFFWWANNVSNYKIVVQGSYDHEQKILKINITP